MLNYQTKTIGFPQTRLATEELQALIDTLGIKSTAPPIVWETIPIVSNRCLLKLHLQNSKESFNVEWMLVDLVIGQPCLDQVYCLAYDPCKCPKVILFSEADQTDTPVNPSTGIRVVQGLTEFLNARGANLNLVELKRRSDRNIVPIVVSSADSTQPLPPEKWIRNVEFWHLYFYEKTNSPDWEYYRCGPDCNGSLREGEFSILAFWDNTGLGYYVDGSPIDHNAKAVFEYSGSKLQFLFPSYEIHYVENFGFIQIRVTGDQIESLLYTNKEKMGECGRKLKSEMKRLLRFMVTEYEYLKLERYTTRNGLLRFDEVG